MDTPTHTSFVSDPHLRSTLVCGVIHWYIYEEKILLKTIKDHPILVGAYTQWLVSNSDRKEAFDAKKLAVKLKYHVNVLSAASYSTTEPEGEEETDRTVTENG